MEALFFWEDRWGQSPEEIYVHKIAGIRQGYTPADTEAQEYTAVCGFEGQSWGMPSQNVVASSTAVDRQGIPAGAILCSGCFPKKEE